MNVALEGAMYSLFKYCRAVFLWVNLVVPLLSSRCCPSHDKIQSVGSLSHRTEKTHQTYCNTSRVCESGSIPFVGGSLALRINVRFFLNCRAIFGRPSLPATRGLKRKAGVVGCFKATGVVRTSAFVPTGTSPSGSSKETLLPPLVLRGGDEGFSSGPFSLEEFGSEAPALSWFLSYSTSIPVSSFGSLCSGGALRLNVEEKVSRSFHTAPNL